MTNLTGIISKEAELAGFEVQEPDDHILELWWKGRQVARFTQTGATVFALAHEIEKALLNGICDN